MARKSRKARAHSEEANVVRFSVSLPKALCDEVDHIADRDSRSRNWVIKKAAEELVKSDQPLFHQR
ncbi:ribbon-helix-helix protein, CopG family [Horticoccus sp. 23ND18S-11]|uniref:ribbon-helix-helix protein, CopG family n=1 Tax=Horticoccus sp. 23ND18S-11 TaxID=3391832 RepID=UPI0039C9C6C2